MTQLTEPTVENLRRAASAVYLACEEAVADDISNLLKWSADQIERYATQGRWCENGHVLLPQSKEEAEMMNIISERFLFPERFPAAVPSTVQAGEAE